MIFIRWLVSVENLKACLDLNLTLTESLLSDSACPCKWFSFQTVLNSFRPITTWFIPSLSADSYFPISLDVGIREFLELTENFVAIALFISVAYQPLLHFPSRDLSMP